MKKTITIALFFLLWTLNSSAQYFGLMDFAGVSTGKSPQADLMFDGTFLYGTTSAGGIHNDGVLFKIKPDGTGYLKLYDFDSINGKQPYGSLISDGTYLYGTTVYGGTSSSCGPNGCGVIFKIKTDGTGFIKLYDFNWTNGYNPFGSLFLIGDFLYGMTQSGGTNNAGVIFRIKKDNTGFVTLLNFTGVLNGAASRSSFIYDGTFLYGMTVFGGTGSCSQGCGVIFKIKPDGTGYLKLHDFDGTNGQKPFGSLVFDGNFLYGMTNVGGINSFGTIFKIKTDGTNFLKLFDFGAANGTEPYGSLIPDGNILYGMTWTGGLYNQGNIFKIRTDGTGDSTLYNFQNGGTAPSGSFISDGSFLYGMTSGGGFNFDGTIFKYAYSPNCFAHYSTIYDSIANNFILNVDSTTFASAVSYHWDFGDGTTSTLATPTHTYSLDTTYNVCMKTYTAAGDSCEYCHIIGKDYLGNIIRNSGFTINVHNFTSGIATIQNPEYSITISPNPFTSQTTISFSEEQKHTSIKITDVLGKAIKTIHFTGKQCTIEKGEMSNGIYFVQITDGSTSSPTNVVKRKIVVQ